MHQQGIHAAIRSRMLLGLAVEVHHTHILVGLYMGGMYTSGAVTAISWADTNRPLVPSHGSLSTPMDHETYSITVSLSTDKYLFMTYKYKSINRIPEAYSFGQKVMPLGCYFGSYFQGLQITEPDAVNSERPSDGDTTLMGD